MIRPAPQPDRAWEILAEVKPLAVEFYRLTGKSLGVTGEIAAYVAAKMLGLLLADARTPGYDATRQGQNGIERIQIKGRAYGEKAKPGQRMSRIKLNADCDVVLLVLLDNATLEPREIWEAPFAKIAAHLAIPGSKSRDRGSMGVAAFKRIGVKVWPASSSE